MSIVVGSFQITTNDGQTNISRDGGGVAGDSGPKISTLLGNRSSDGGSLHLALIIHNDSSVILEVDELSIFSPKSLPLTDNDCRHDFFPQFRLSLKLLLIRDANKKCATLGASTDFNAFIKQFKTLVLGVRI